MKFLEVVFKPLCLDIIFTFETEKLEISLTFICGVGKRLIAALKG